MSRDPSVSIVLPAYNAESFIEETVQAVFDQTVADWELVVVNDGSKDRTLEIVRQYERDPRVRVFDYPNGGESLARTRGLQQTHHGSEYVLFLDHDDVLVPDFLEVLLEKIGGRPDAVGVYSSGRMIDAKGDPAEEGFLEGWCRNRVQRVGNDFVPLAPDDPTTFDTLAYGCCVIGGPCISSMTSCLLRKRFLPKENVFNPRMKTGSADLHLYLRLALHGPFLFVDQPLYLKRLHANNITNDQRAVDLSVYDAFLDVAHTTKMEPRQRSILSDAYKLRAKKKAQQLLNVARERTATMRLPAALVNVARSVPFFIRSARGVG